MTDLHGGAVDAATSMWEWAARAFEPLVDGRTPWREVARPEQLPPDGDYLTWLFMAGRGAGKTRSCAEAITEDALRYPGLRAALVAPTYADGRDTMVEGESGLLEVIPERELRGRNRELAWNRSMGELYLANGSRFKIFSSEKPGRLRGPQHHVVWGDEIAQWQDVMKGTAKDSTWSNILFGLRLPSRPGWPTGFRNRLYVSTTPRPVPLLKVSATVLKRDPERAGVLQRPDTVVTRGRTADNLANLSEQYRTSVIDPLVGTTLGRQELDAELIEDLDGAYLSHDVVERGRLPLGDVEHLVALVVSVDPATTTGESSDETGIVVCGMDSRHHGYLLDDYTGKHTPEQWGTATWEAVWEHDAQAIVIEDNQGGDMVQHVLTTTWEAAARRRQRTGRPSPAVPIVRVHPSGTNQGKWVRAMTLQPSWEQARIHVVDDPAKPGRMEALVDQGCTWTGDKDEDSPDHIDAAVHGLTWLMFPRQRSDKNQGAGSGSRWSGGSGRR